MKQLILRKNTKQSTFFYFDSLHKNLKQEIFVLLREGYTGKFQSIS